MPSRGRIALSFLLFLLVLLGFFHLRRSDDDILSGSVHDAAGPMAGAIVRIKGDSRATFSDQSGRFQLRAPRGIEGTITAAKEGYFIAGSPSGRAPLTLSLRRLPSEDCQAYRWIDPTPDAAVKNNCGNCHAEIYREWSASSHANSIRNRHFLNLFEGTDWQGRNNVGWSLLKENPDGAGVCTACHGPTVPFNDPAYYDPRQARGVNACGVHCDFCHKINDAPTANLGITHGRFGLSLLRPAEGQLNFGPLDDVDRGEDSYSPLYRESRYCAACHEGTVFGVHVYGTYSEWLASPARREGKQCQTCHMKPTGTMTNFAPGKGGIERNSQTLASHRFEGKQEAMLNSCLRVSVMAQRKKDGVHAQVTVLADDVGHWVPTGFADRNLVLVVEAQGERGQAIAGTTGPSLSRAAGKAYAGLPGRLYAKLLRDSDGAAPVPFWRSVPEVVDSRLLPRQPDLSEFRFPPSVTQLRVRLLFRRFWPDVAEAKHWPDNETVVVDEVVSLLGDRTLRWSSH